MGRPALALIKTTADGSTIKLRRGTCGEWLPLEKFSKHSSSAGGRRNFCTTCEGRRAYKNNRERVIKNVRAYQKRYPEDHKLRHRAGRRHQHKKRMPGPGVSVHEYKELIKMYGGCCAYCGGPYETMDHVTPISRGGLHIVDNMVPACKRCNFTKHTMTYAQWQRSRKKGR